MPISKVGDLPAQHWLDVKTILTKAMEEAGFVTELVSSDDTSGVIHARIMQRLYDDDIIVCDMSASRPNVMFELGIRLAFDKPTVLIKDVETEFSFDTSTIDHLLYPRSLRHPTMEEFQRTLAAAVRSAYQEGQTPGYSPFLGHFGRFSPKKFELGDINKDDLIIDMLERMTADMTALKKSDTSLVSVAYDKEQVAKNLGRLFEILQEIATGMPEFQSPGLKAGELDPRILKSVELALRYMSPDQWARASLGEMKRMLVQARNQNMQDGRFGPIPPSTVTK